MFSGEYGVIRVMAKGVRRKGSKDLPLTLPFAFGKYQLVRGKNDLHTLLGGELVENFYALSEDIDRFTAAGDVTAELLKNTVPDDAEPEVLRLYLGTLFALSYTRKEIDTVKAVFTLRLNKELGFLPESGDFVKKYMPGAGNAAVQAIDHVFGCEMNKLYGFTASDDIQKMLSSAAAAVRKES